MAKDYLKDLMEKAKQSKTGKVEEKEVKKVKASVGVKKVKESAVAKKEKIVKKAEKPEIDKAIEELGGKVEEVQEKPVEVEEVKEEKPAEGKVEVRGKSVEDALKKIVEPVEEVEEKVEGKAKAEVEKELESASKKKLVEEYGNVKIYKIAGKALPYYYIPTPRPTEAEKNIINTIKEATTRLVAITPYRIRDQEQRRAVYKQKILEILQAAPELKIPKGRFEFYANAVVREMVGYGLIDSLVKDDALEEIMVVGSHEPVYVFHRKYEMMKTNIEFYSNEEINDLINRIGREIGRRIDFSNPLVDARLPDGSRVHAAIAPAAISGSTLTIRKFKKDPYSIIDLIKFNTLSSEAAAFLWLCAEGLGIKPANILIAGGTGSGKTTLLNVLASFITPNERIITIEDTSELNLPLDHWVRLEARPPGLEEKGELTLDILTKNSLRMRPDRILVGEIRHAEAFTLFTAMNTGHQGSFGTVHANSSKETIVRVTSPPMNVPTSMLSGLDFIIVEQRIHDKKKGTMRRLTEISEVTGVLEGNVDTPQIFERNAKEDSMERTSVPSNYLRELEDFSGLSQKTLLQELKNRQEFFEKLVKNNVREMSQVKGEMEKYLGNNKEGK